MHFKSKILSPEYIVGLVDGEGSFTVYVKNPNTSNKTIRRVCAEPKFYVKLIEKDKIILFSLQKYFGCGNIYFQKDTRPNHQQCYRYEVGKREDLLKVIIPFFKKYLLKFPSKQHDFVYFCKIIECMEKGEHLTNKGLKKLYDLKQKMH